MCEENLKKNIIRQAYQSQQLIRIEVSLFPVLRTGGCCCSSLEAWIPVEEMLQVKVSLEL